MIVLYNYFYRIECFIFISFIDWNNFISLLVSMIVGYDFILNMYKVLEWMWVVMEVSLFI